MVEVTVVVKLVAIAVVEVVDIIEAAVVKLVAVAVVELQTDRMTRLK